MTSVQERLKLKRAPIDTWSTREKLCLASSVLRSGDQNWMSVSRSLKAFGDPGRPADWFSQRSCAAQYSNLLENVETPKRKKRTGDKVDSVETPSESIVRRLTQERIEELKRLMQEDRLKYAKLKDEVMQVKSGLADDRLDDMLAEIEEEKRQEVKRAEAHEQWLREREEKKIEIERAWKPPVAPASPHRRKHHRNMMRRNSNQSEPSSEADSALDSPLSEPLNVDVIGEESVHETTPVEPKPAPTPTSPLLTSLLKSPSPAPNVQGSSILHSAITSSRGASPTITSLLNSSPGIPVTGNMVTVAPPATVSPSLKNLVSSAISSEQPHHQLPPPNPSPAAGAPTLSMLLELPPSLPGKPLPELPSAAKVTTTLPPSTLSAIVSAAGMPTSTVARVTAMQITPPVTITSPVKAAAVAVTASGSEEVCTRASEDETSAPVDRIQSIAVVPVSVPSASQLSEVEKKEDPIEVLLEEVILNDEATIDTDILSSEVPDVVVSAEQVVDSKVREEPAVEELKLDEFIELSSDAPSQKEDLKEDDLITESDNTVGNVEEEGIDEESPKEENIEGLIESGTQDVPSDVVEDGRSSVEVDPATDAELTSGAVAEVIEIADEQEGAEPTEVVNPCLQELEDMEVIILDKMQGLDEVQIVEEMKDLECEVVEVVMGAQEKTVEGVKEKDEKVALESVEPDDGTSAEAGETESTVESENVEEINKSLIESCAEVVSTDTSEAIVDGSTVSEDVTVTEKMVVNVEDKNTSVKNESVLPSLVDKKIEDSEQEIISPTDSGTSRKEEVEDNITTEPSEDQKTKEESINVKDVVEEVKIIPTKDVSKKETREGVKKDVLKESSRRDSVKDSLRKDPTSSDSRKEQREESMEATPKEKDIMEVKKEPVKEAASGKKDTVREPVKEEELKEAPLKKDDVAKPLPSKPEDQKEVSKERKELNQRKELKDTPLKETISRTREESKSNRETPRKELPIREGSRKASKEAVRKDQAEKQVVRDTVRDYGRRTPKRELVSKETVKEIHVKEGKKEMVKEIQVKEGKKETVKETPMKEGKKEAVQEIQVKEGKKETQVREGKKETVQEQVRESKKETVKEIQIKEGKKEAVPEMQVKEGKKETQVGEGKKDTGKEIQVRESKKDTVKEIQVRESKKDTVKEIQVRESKKETVKEIQVKESKKETVKDIQVKEGKKETVTEMQVKETNKRDVTPESDPTKSTLPKEITKKDTSVKDVKETPSKKEVLRRDSKEERKDTARRGVVREERKESGRDDLRKRSQLKEMSRSMTRKADAEKKNPDASKPEVGVRMDKSRRESADINQIETIENKRERAVSESKQKREEVKLKEDASGVKDTVQISGTPVRRSSKTEVENKEANDVFRKEPKESTKGGDEIKSLEVQEPSDQKAGKRTPVRAETPSTEDDKTNDAEPPKTVGRKRLTTANIVDSVPNSPASASTTEEEKEYRAWKKSIMLLYGRLATHKFASLFLRPITDEQAPGYSSVVHRPIDLLTIKKNIETGVIRSTVEFQRDVMLMFQNSIMYNKSNHFVHKMARQMQQEGMQHIQDFLSTQMLLQVAGGSAPIRRETRTTEANKHRDMLVNPATLSSQDEGDISLHVHKRKRNIGDMERVLKKKKVDD